MPEMSTPPRLSAATLARAAAGTALPGYDRDRLGTGIVHLGLGAFVRAHLAAYTEDVLNHDFGPWGITGVSLQRPDQRDLLAPQDGLYTLLERDGTSARARIVGCVTGLLVAPESPAAVIAAMADPGCRIVSLTVTEKGYCHDPATGQLDLAHPAIRADLANQPGSPRSAIGFLVAALARRRAAGLPPFTALSCDNLPHNGRVLAGLVDAFARQTDPALADWIARHGAFPCTMVDRIVPAATQADRDAVLAATGLADAAPVSHEPFRQWVIEDRFVDGTRPAWESAGATIVADVAPYEHMKLRLLNAAHSALAYLGYLAGHETIVDAVEDPVLRAYAERLWRTEIIPMVPPPQGVDLAAYAADLMARFANPAIRHRTWQIAADGSQKLPQRLLATIRERRAAGLPFPLLAHAVAGWVRYTTAIDENGAPIDVRDPLAEALRATAGPADAARLDRILSLTAVFGGDLTRDEVFRAAVVDAHTALIAAGARAATERLL